MNDSLRELTDATFDAATARGLCLVELGTAWCAPCRALLPVLAGLAGELAGRVAFAKVDVDDSPSLGQRFAVRSLPTLILLRDGRAIDERHGALPRAKLRAWLDGHLAAAPGTAIATP